MPKRWLNTKALVFSVLLVASLAGAVGNFTLYEYSQPANFTSIDLIAGGSLTENQTYCFKYAVGGDGWNAYACSTNTFYMWSQVSNETCVTTNATHKTINMTWAKSAEPSYDASYIVYLNHSLGYDPIINNTYYSNTVFDSDLNRYMPGFMVESRMEDASQCNNSVCWQTWDGLNQSYQSQPYREHGVPFLDLSGGTTAAPITPWDIYDWLVNNQSREEFIEFMPTAPGLQEAGAYKFTFSFGDYGASSQTYSFNIPLNVVVMHDLGKYGGCVNGNFTMGSVDAYGTFQDGGVYLRTSYPAMYNQAQGAFKVSASIVSGGYVGATNGYGAAGSHGFQFGAGEIAFNGAIYVSSLGRMHYGATINNSLMITGADWGNNDWVKNVVMDNAVFSKYTIGSGYTLQEVIYRNFRSYPEYTGSQTAWASAQYSNYGNYTHIYHFVNPYWNIPHSRIRVYCSGTDHPTRVSQEYELKLNVVDSETGLPIENATLTIQNVNGSYDSFSPPITSLYDTVNATAGFLRLIDSSDFAAGDYLKSGNEYMKVTGVNATSVQVTRGEFNTTPWSLRHYRNYHTMIVFKSWREQYSDANGDFELVRLQQKWWQKDICDTAYTYWWLDTEGNASSPFVITVNASGYNNFTTHYTPTQANEFTIGLVNATECPECNQSQPVYLFDSSQMTNEEFIRISSETPDAPVSLVDPNAIIILAGGVLLALFLFSNRKDN